MNRISYALLIVSLTIPALLRAQSSLPDIGPPIVWSVRGDVAWSADWIRHPEGPRHDFGVFYFRKSFELSEKPDSFVVHISGDNRYRLYVNGTSVVAGPALGDLEHWRYATVDIAPHLHSGNNALATVVWNFGQRRPHNQISNETAFILAGDGSAESVVNTGRDNGWVVCRDDSYSPIRIRVGGWYYAVGPGEEIDGTQYIWGWNEPDFDDSNWKAVESAGPGRPACGQPGAAWQLMPRPIPLVREIPNRFSRVRRQEGEFFNDAFLRGNASVTIPPHTKTSVLIDNDELATSYPVLQLSGGKGALIQTWYAEALWDTGRVKDNRDDITGKHIDGNRDVFHPDGGDNRRISTLFWRTFRYVQLDIETADEPLVLHDYDHIFTSYPFDMQASFECDDPRLSQVWDVAFRTLLCCSYDSFTDCPYYEQISYLGDGRSEALTSYYATGDDRLGRNTLMLYHDSRPADGPTYGRWPTSNVGFHPSYSLEFVKMVYDYWWYRDDPAFVRRMLPGTRATLDWMERHLDKSGLLGAVPGWNYIDMAWPRGIAPGVLTGGSSILSLSYARALRMAAQMETALGWDGQGMHYRQLSDRIIRSVMQLCWDENRGLIADTPDKNTFSQHASLMGVLVDAIPKERQRAVMKTVLTDASLARCQLFYQFFLHRAVRKAGLADQYVELLQPWFRMLNSGLTTFAEFDDLGILPRVRSDCHAWSSHPMYHMLATVAGVESIAPGFAEVKISPSLGPLQFVKATVPHPKGVIRVDLKREGAAGLAGSVTLPAGISGTFEWQDRQDDLHGGLQTISFP